MFSSSLVKTLPFASQEMHVGFADGRMRMTGPIMSDGASAVTQLLSSSPVAAIFETVSALEELSAASSLSPLGALRFLDFLSPLKDSGLTMIKAGKVLVIVETVFFSWLECHCALFTYISVGSRHENYPPTF